MLFVVCAVLYFTRATIFLLTLNAEIKSLGNFPIVLFKYPTKVLEAINTHLMITLEYIRVAVMFIDTVIDLIKLLLSLLVKLTLLTTSLATVFLTVAVPVIDAAILSKRDFVVLSTPITVVEALIDFTKNLLTTACVVITCAMVLKI